MGEIRKNKARTGGNQQQNYKRIGTFGKPTVPSEAAMSSLIGGEYTSYDIDHEEYPDMSGQYKRGKLPNPRTTTAANGHNVNTDGLTTNPKPAQSAKEPFIMKKFKNAKSKVEARQKEGTCVRTVLKYVKLCICSMRTY